MSSARRWDAIVVGAGPAGCVAAARLAASGRQVLLAEAGPGEPRPASVAGLDTIAAAEELSRQWPELRARSSAAGAPTRYRQGFGLGGGSMINSLVLSPGDSADYRRWEIEHGCSGWGPHDMAPWLDRASTAFSGVAIERGPFSAGFAAAAAAAGHPVGGSSLDQDRLGVLETRLAAVDGRRLCALDAFGPFQSHSSRQPSGSSWSVATGQVDASEIGPTIVAGEAVLRILTEGNRAVGVAMAGGDEIHAPLVVLSAGAIRTPALLLRSNLTERPVGARLKDHPSFSFTVSLNHRWLQEQRPGREDRWMPRTISTMLRWSSGPDHVGDLQAFVIDRVDEAVDGRQQAGRTGPGPMAVVVVGLMEVSSLGSIALGDQISHAAAHNAISITTGALQTTDDRRRLRAGVSHAADLLRSPEMAEMIDEVFVDDHGTPLEHLRAMNEEEIDRWIAGHPGPYAHPAGSCPMGPASTTSSVVSCEAGDLGRLLGYEGVHLADASVLPDLVRGGLQIPTVAVAERISADLARS